MKYEHSERAKEILDDLLEYTGKPRDLVVQRCKYAAYELAFLWGKRRDTLSYYRDTDLYIYDLTSYQSMIVPEVNYMVEAAEKHKMKKVLDLGGGIGEYTLRLMKEAGVEVTYLDLKGSETLKYAQWRFDKHKVRPKIVFEDEKWQNEKWDAIVAMDVLEHMENAQEVLAQIEKSTKFLFANPEKIKFNDLYPQHISEYQLANFEEIGLNLYKIR